MTPEFKNKMDVLFSSHLDKMKRATHEDEEKAIKEQMYLMEFYKKKKDEIRPAMEKIQNYITSLGYPVEIEETYDIISSENKHTDASIAIQFMHIEDLTHPEYKNPFFSVTCDKKSEEVVLYQFTISPVKHKGYRSGPEERISLDEINQNLIQNKIYEVLLDIF